MVHIQDNIEYRIEDDVLKGWKEKPSFKKPQWNGSIIIEGWTQADSDAQLEFLKVQKIKALKGKAIKEINDKNEWDYLVQNIKGTKVKDEKLAKDKLIIDFVEIKEAEINALTTIAEVNNYII